MSLVQDIHYATQPQKELGVKVLGKTFQILNLLASEDEPLSILSIASMTGLNRTTVHRTVQVLSDAGFIEASQGSDNKYTIGPSILPLAARYLNRNRLRSVALSHLHPLTVRTGTRGHLGIELNGSLMYLGGFDRPQIPSIYSWFGRLAPMHCSSLGKALLAFMSEDNLNAMLDACKWERFTENTITDQENLYKQILEIRKNRFAFDNSEHIQDNYCIGVPILGPRKLAMAAISLSSRNKEILLDACEDLQRTGEIISLALAAPQID